MRGGEVCGNGRADISDFSFKKGQAAIPEFCLSDDSKHVIRGILHSKSKEGDGIIDVDELGDCLEAFGFSPDDEDVDFLKAHLDDNGDGELEVEEIMDNIDVINWHSFYGKELMDEFTRIDKDKDHYIRFPEMLRMLTTHGPNPLPPKQAGQLLDRLARKYDENFDGKFSYAEFVKIYMSDELPFKAQLEAGIIPSESKPGATKRRTIKKKPSKLKTTSDKGTTPKTTANVTKTSTAAKSAPTSRTSAATKRSVPKSRNT